MKNTNEELQQKLTESERYGRQADITIENLERKVEQLAAENAALQSADAWMKADQIGGEAADKAIEAGLTPDEATRAGIQAVIESIKTPSTDAILAEVRASAITDALKSLDGVFDTDCVMESNGISYEDAEQRTAGAYAVSKSLEDFAAQLRKGVQS